MYLLEDTEATNKTTTKTDPGVPFGRKVPAIMNPIVSTAMIAGVYQPQTGQKAMCELRYIIIATAEATGMSLGAVTSISSCLGSPKLANKVSEAKTPKQVSVTPKKSELTWGELKIT